MKSYVLFFLLFINSILVTAQNSVPCSNDSLYQVLDFWIGEWSVYDPDKKILFGSNTIVKELNGCAISEHWKSAKAGEGKSLFYVDNKIRTWKQVWVTTTANQPMGQKEKTMVREKENEVIFEGRYPYNGIELIDRTTLSLLRDGTVQQKIEVSSDSGKNWRVTFLGIYHKM